MLKATIQQSGFANVVKLVEEKTQTTKKARGAKGELVNASRPNAHTLRDPIVIVIVFLIVWCITQ